MNIVRSVSCELRVISDVFMCTKSRKGWIVNELFANSGTEYYHIYCTEYCLTFIFAIVFQLF